jgi:hypothetical protein
MEIKLMALQFQRNADVYIEVMDTARSSVQTTWRLPVLEGFSFTQSINSSEITINEAGETSRRARLLFNDSLAPAEWSFNTYIRPVLSDGVILAPEQALWAMMFGAKSFDPDGTDSSPVGSEDYIYYGGSAGTTAVNVRGGTVSPNALTNTFNMNASNISAMPDNWNVVFAFEDGTNKQYFRLNKAVVNSASVDFEIDGIATAAWSGFSQDIEDLGTSAPSNLATAITTGTTGSDNFIRNRISTVDLARTDKLVGSLGTDEVRFTLADSVYSVAADSPAFVLTTSSNQQSNVSVGDLATATGVSGTATVTAIDGTSITFDKKIDGISGPISFYTANRDVYNIVLTGGSFSIENNVTYLTPEELGNVNTPLANITGARTVTGSLTCYFDNDQTNSKSGELFADLVSDTTTVRNTFDMAVNVGGETKGTPRIAFDLPTAHLEVPTINVEDLLTLEVTFHGQVANGDVDSTNEATIIYKA